MRREKLEAEQQNTDSVKQVMKCWDLLMGMLKRARARVSEANKLSLKGQQMIGFRVG